MNMTHPDILEVERNGLPDGPKSESVSCLSCDRAIRDEQQDRCAFCQQPGCTGPGGCLTEIETGEKVCENCKEIAVTPLQVAAKRAARTGTHRDLQKYLQAKRNIA
ncbi:MAG: hypothetical protein ABIK07_16405 [Planctomycetota bacterium]